MVDLKDFIIVIAGILLFPGLPIFFTISHVRKGSTNVLTTRLKQIDPLTGLQLPENQGNFDTPDTMVLAEDMEIAAAVDDDD